MALAAFSSFLFLLATLLLLLLTGSVCKPPPEPVQCGPGGCFISNTYGAWPDGSPHCTADSASYPTTEEELVAAVAAAVRRGQKLKVISKWAHSIPKLACPGSGSIGSNGSSGSNGHNGSIGSNGGSDGSSGSSGPNGSSGSIGSGGGSGWGHVISTRDYNRRIVVDQARRTVEVDAGVELRRLVDMAAEHGLALPYAPYWAGVSVAGLISTGAHGSSLYQKGGAVHEYVVGMRIVVPASPQEGYARVVAMAEDSEELNAARVSLGVLGAISTVSPPFFFLLYLSSNS